MAPESSIPAAASDESGIRFTTLDQEIKELISALMGSIQRGPKPGDMTTAAAADGDEGVRIITLAGTNLGATMRGEMDDKAAGPQGQALPEQDDFMTYVNNNFQAINNSIMVGGSYDTNDPGVHLDIVDHADKGEHKSEEP